MNQKSVAYGVEQGNYPARRGVEWIPVASLVAGVRRFGPMVGRSKATDELIAKICSLAPCSSSVLLNGESGSGKELVARALHEHGSDPGGRYVVVNGSHLGDRLRGRDIAGYLIGMFEGADSGTLFLDHVSALSLYAQAELSGMLRSRDQLGIGKLRIVAATNRDLHAMAARAEFRSDLLGALSESSIAIAPLRSRPEEIAALAAHFILELAPPCGQRIQFISQRALDALRGYRWPGNVRELRNVIETAILLAPDEGLEVGDLMPEWQMAAAIDEPPPSPAPSSTDTQNADAVREGVLGALRQAHGNYVRAACLLGISRSTLYRMLARYGICRADWRSAPAENFAAARS